MMNKIQIGDFILHGVVELMGLCDLITYEILIRIHIQVKDEIGHHIQLNLIYEMMIYGLLHLNCMVMLEKHHLKL